MGVQMWRTCGQLPADILLSAAVLVSNHAGRINLHAFVQFLLVILLKQATLNAILLEERFARLGCSFACLQAFLFLGLRAAIHENFGL